MDKMVSRPAHTGSIGQRLRRAREQLNWSQARLAKEFDKYDMVVSISSINRWEKDKTVPGPYYRELLCNVFKMSNEDLFGVGEVGKDEAAAQANVPIWNVPYLRNLYFTGREDMLASLHEILTPQKTVALTALKGLGGIGKTQLAVEYAYRYGGEYEAVLWVRADNSQSMITDYLMLADLLDLPEKGEVDQRRVVAAVLRWLQAHQHWLLILDNADDLEQITELLPKRGGGHTLLTTRSQITGSAIKGIELEAMGRQEGTLLLLRRAKRLSGEATLEQVIEAERRDAVGVCELLGGLPLALDQAGAYIEENQCSIADYLRLYHVRRADLLKRRGALSTKEHPQAVATTWALSFEHVELANPAAADLLRLCAFLHPDAIPEAMLLAGATELGPVLKSLAADPLQWDEAIGELRRYSLVRRTVETKMLNMHRLVQVVLKEAIAPETYRQWAERAVRVVNQAFPNTDEEFAAWSICQQYLAHALVCAGLVQQENMMFPEAARLLHQTGCYVHVRGLYAEAEPLKQHALAIREQVLGSEHPLTALSLNDLALLYHHQGKYAQAEPLYQRALTIRERVLGTQHLDTAESLNNLAALYRLQGRYAQAEELYQRALAINEQMLGTEHPLTALILNNLAVLYYQQGKYAQAEPLHQRALAINEQALGPEHPYTAYSLNRLAVLYSQQGKYKQAEPLHQRALAINEQVLGSEHPLTAESLNALAVLYCQQGKYELAEPLHQRALTINEQVLGPDHSYTAYSLNALAALYCQQGKYEQAEPLHQRALAINEQVLGPDHPDTAQSLHGLAELYRRQGKYEQAELYLQRVLVIRLQSLGSAHPDTAQSLNSLAMCYRDQGRYDEAEPLFQQALMIVEQALGSEHPMVAEIMENCATLLRQTQQREKATVFEVRAKAIHSAHSQKA